MEPGDELLASSEGTFLYSSFGSSSTSKSRTGVLELIKGRDGSSSLQFHGRCDFLQSVQVESSFKVQCPREGMLMLTLGKSGNRIKFQSKSSIAGLLMALETVLKELDLTGIVATAPPARQPLKSPLSFKSPCATGSLVSGMRSHASLGKRMVAASLESSESGGGSFYGDASAQSLLTPDLSRFDSRPRDNLDVFNTQPKTQFQSSLASSEDQLLCSPQSRNSSFPLKPEKASRHGDARSADPLLVLPMKRSSSHDDLVSPKRRPLARPPIYRPPRSLSAPKQKVEGFVNIGNTCYMNSSLQAILAIPSFRQDILSPDMLYHAKPDSLYTYVAALARLNRQSMDMDEQVKVLRRVKDCLSEKFNGNVQQDAHEFLSEVLDILQSPTPPAAGENKENDTRPLPRAVNVATATSPCPVTANFEGGLRHTFVCNHCRHVTKTDEFFRYLSLELPSVSNDSDPWLEVEEMLKTFLQNEEIEKHCEKCQHESATARHSFRQLPRVLILHTKRVGFDLDANWRTKRDNRINIASCIGIDRLCSRDTTLPCPFVKTAAQSTPSSATSHGFRNHEAAASNVAAPTTPSSKHAWSSSKAACSSSSSHSGSKVFGSPFTNNTLLSSRPSSRNGLHSKPKLSPRSAKPKQLFAADWGTNRMPPNSTITDAVLSETARTSTGLVGGGGSVAASFPSPTTGHGGQRINDTPAEATSASASNGVWCLPEEVDKNVGKEAGSGLVGGLGPFGSTVSSSATDGGSLATLSEAASVADREGVRLLPEEEEHCEHGEVPGSLIPSPPTLIRDSNDELDADTKKAMELSLQDMESGTSSFLSDDEAMQRAINQSLQEFEQNDRSGLTSPSAASAGSAVALSANQSDGSAQASPTSSDVRLRAPRPTPCDTPPSQKELTESKIVYRLVGVVSHIGAGTSAGHFVADARGEGATWYSYDDSAVSKITEEEVRRKRSRSAYIFFYMHQSVFDESFQGAFKSS